MFVKWIGFVKTLVKWCKQSGKTSSSSLENNLGTPKIPKSKVENPWTPSKQSWKPQILKQYPQHYFLHVELSKWQGKNWRLWNFIMSFNKKHSIKVHKTKGKYLVSLFMKLHTKKLKTPKWQEEDWRLQIFKIYKQKVLKVHKKKGKYPIAPLMKLHTKKWRPPKW